MKYLYWSIAMLMVLGITGACIWMSNKIPKTGYVDLKEIYNDFKMTKELEGTLSNVQQQRKLVLDSMVLRINLTAKQIEKIPEKSRTVPIQGLDYKKQEYYMKKKQFDEDNENTLRQYNEQVWKQLNQYVKDYAKEHHYNYVFGADGTGTLMYGDDAQEITLEIKKYSNARYKGLGK